MGFVRLEVKTNIKADAYNIVGMFSVQNKRAGEVIVLKTAGRPEGGSVHQARIANAQGRKVFVVKPKKENKRALEGFKLLVGEGATPVDSIKPVAEYLRSIPTGKIEERKIDSFYQNNLQLSMKKWCAQFGPQQALCQFLLNSLNFSVLNKIS